MGAMSEKLLRFIVNEIHPESGRRMGVFQSVSRLRNENLVAGADRKKLDELWEWFDKRLLEPDRKARSKKKSAAHRAISWFKPTASHHLARMAEMTEILGRHGVAVETITTDKPGYVTYEDEFQVAAEPFADTGA